MKNDWCLTDERLMTLLPSTVKLPGSLAGASFVADFQQELLKDPTPLQTILSAFTKLISEAKARRKADDPWPVIIIDEANRLSCWKETEREVLEQLLTFFVYVTKQEQLAHGEPPLLAASLGREASFVSSLQWSWPPATRFCCSGLRLVRRH